MAGTAVIYVGGADGPQVDPRLDPSQIAVAIAADSGLSVAMRLGHRVDVVVGDLDSVEPDQLARARDAGVAVEQHDHDKDDTDLELAVARALAERPDRVVAVGGAGGRLDHLVANLLVLCGPSLAAVDVDAFLGTAQLTVIRGRRELAGAPGELMSLLAWGGPAIGVTTEGLRWPLRDATLRPGDALGTSNEFLDGRAAVSITAGVLSAIRPDVTTTHPLEEVTP